MLQTYAQKMQPLLRGHQVMNSSDGNPPLDSSTKPLRPPPSEQAKVDDLLVQRFCAGDLLAFEILVAKYQRRVAALINTSVRNDSVAEELTQETFLRVYRGLPNFRFESAFSTWLYTIARNITTSYHRDGRDRADRLVSLDNIADETGSDNFLLHEGAAASAEEEVSAQQLLAAIQVAIEKLSPQSRDALLLRETQDLSYIEIAERLKVPLNTARSLIFRARATIATEIRPLLNKAIDGSTE
jgi:RNA polymerase sigma-70 factor, ECF subfamily